MAEDQDAAVQRENTADHFVGYCLLHHLLLPVQRVPGLALDIRPQRGLYCAIPVGNDPVEIDAGPISRDPFGKKEIREDYLKRRAPAYLFS